MSGYRYKSQNEIADIINSVVFDSKILSNLGSAMSKKTLKGSGAGGRSEVIRKFRNGVQTKITYEYRYPERIEPVYSGTMLTGYNVYTELRSDCSGYREVYQFGRSFYVLDRFPAEDHPGISDLTFASSWNMPANTDSVPGRPGCFEGVRPEPVTGLPQTKIQIAVKGYTDTAVAIINRAYNLTTNYDFDEAVDDYLVKQILATNHNDTDRTMLACITCRDGTESFPAILIDSYRSMSGRTYWGRLYRDGSIDVIVYNPHNTTYTYDEIESNAYIFIVHLDRDGGGNARLYDYTTVSTDSHRIVYQKDGQCDIQM